MIDQSNLRDAAVHALFTATNAFNVEAAVALFKRDAVIDDSSTGHKFVGQSGIRDYVERYFMGYHTVSRVLTIDHLGYDRVRVRVDFTGDFGHEVGVLEIVIGPKGLIHHIDADLE
jgi:hypothetical protein